MPQKAFELKPQDITATMTVKHVTSMDEYKTALETSKTKLVVIDFSAVW
jgi:hypothetical protein